METDKAASWDDKEVGLPSDARQTVRQLATSIHSSMCIHVYAL